MPLVAAPHLQVDHIPNGHLAVAVTFTPLYPADITPTLDGAGAGHNIPRHMRDNGTFAPFLRDVLLKGKDPTEPRRWFPWFRQRRA